jgi:hypothetical protein
MIDDTASIGVRDREGQHGTGIIHRTIIITTNEDAHLPWTAISTA